VRNPANHKVVRPGIASVRLLSISELFEVIMCHGFFGFTAGELFGRICFAAPWKGDEKPGCCSGDL